jgi:hypothetical protein
VNYVILNSNDLKFELSDIFDSDSFDLRIDSYKNLQVINYDDNTTLNFVTMEETILSELTKKIEIKKSKKSKK